MEVWNPRSTASTPAPPPLLIILFGILLVQHQIILPVHGTKGNQKNKLNRRISTATPPTGLLTFPTDHITQSILDVVGNPFVGISRQFD